MNRRSLACILPLLIGFNLSLANTAEDTVALVEAWMEDTRAVGVTVSVGRSGELIWSQGFGYADLEQQVPVDPGKTLFRVGSVAKPMTAAAVGLLMEQQKLDLDVPVQRYVPSFPEKEGIITARLLAGHLAGIRHYKGDEMFNNEHFETVTKGLRIFQDDPLIHPPGSRYSYSSYGYNLLSAVVEGASKRDFLEYMSEHVFEPLGMKNTHADHVYSILPGRGRYYVRHGGTTVNAPAVDNSYKWAGGGLLSTSEDLVTFGFAHLGTSLLKEETIRLLWTPQETSKGKQTNYGIGWRIEEDDSGRSYIGHNGGSVGGATVFRIYPEKNLVIAMISNLSGHKYKNIPDQIVAQFWE